MTTLPPYPARFLDPPDAYFSSPTHPCIYCGDDDTDPDADPTDAMCRTCYEEDAAAQAADAWYDARCDR